MERTLDDAQPTDAAKPAPGQRLRRPRGAKGPVVADVSPTRLADTDDNATATALPANESGTGLGGSGVDIAAVTPADARTDEQLLDAYRHGDKSSFAMLVGRYQRELYHFLTRFLGDRIAAEDVFQETFLQVHQSRDQFDPSRRFKPWLFTIAANKARDLMRSRARRPTNPLQASVGSGEEEGAEYIDLMAATGPAGRLPEEPLQEQEMKDSVQRIVQSMPDHLREILLLSYFHQFPYKQIGDILDIPLGTVKSRLHAAVAYFADRWKAAN